MLNSYGYKVSNSTESILLVSNNNHYASLVSLSARIRLHTSKNIHTKRSTSMPTIYIQIFSFIANILKHFNLFTSASMPILFGLFEHFSPHANIGPEGLRQAAISYVPANNECWPLNIRYYTRNIIRLRCFFFFSFSEYVTVANIHISFI